MTEKDIREVELKNGEKSHKKLVQRCLRRVHLYSPQRWHLCKCKKEFAHFHPALTSERFGGRLRLNPKALKCAAGGPQACADLEKALACLVGLKRSCEIKINIKESLFEALKMAGNFKETCVMQPLHHDDSSARSVPSGLLLFCRRSCSSCTDIMSFLRLLLHLAVRA